MLMLVMYADLNQENTQASMILRRARGTATKRVAFTGGALLLVQVTLGISNVVGGLPLPVAVAHNGVAALLLLSLITLIWMVLQGPSKKGG